MTFLAGHKALEYSQHETAVLRQLRKKAGCCNAELLMAFEKAVNQSNDLSKEITRLWSLLMPGLVRTAQVIEVQETRIGVLITEVPRALVAKLAAMIAQTVEGAGMVMNDRDVAVSSSGVSAKEILDKILKITGGKGGGSVRAAQGKMDRKATFDEIRVYLKENAEGLN